MAKKRKSKKTKKTEEVQTSGFWRGVGAVALIIAGIVLGFGSFISAPIPRGFWDGTWDLFGVATVIIPFLLVYLGSLKFLSEDGQIPLSRLAGTIGMAVFAAGLLHTTGEHGGSVGKAIGDVLIDALGKFLATIIFLALTIFAAFFTFKIDPKVVLRLGGIFRGQPKEGGEEDLASLKSKMSPFKLNEGVPLEHAPQSRMTGFRKSSEKVAPAAAAAALTTASDPDWQFPSIELLSDKQDKANAGDVKGNAEIIKETFANFNYDVEVQGANVGPRITQYTIKPPTGVKLTKLTSLDGNLALDLAAHSIRMEAPIPGTRTVGVEVPNVKPATVTIRGILSSSEWSASRGSLSFAVGKDIAGQPVVSDLEEMPHLLIAGQTKSGKSVMINTVLASLLYRNSPSDIKLILVDPKYVEMAPYHDIPHLLAPVITEPEKCISALKWAVAEMERRLKTFSEFKQRDIQGYNKLKKEEGMPYIVVVIDELADLMMVASRDVETLIARVAQKGRAAGIHLVIATQRPDAKVVTGLIKANVPAQIAFAVKDQVNSRIIIDQGGAEKLLGKGDMLFKTTDLPRPTRIQGALITGDETNKLCDFLRGQRSPQYDDAVVTQPVQLPGRGGTVGQAEGSDDDPQWKEAVDVVVNSGKASTSLLQRKLRIGYGRASRLIDMMEEQGIIGPADGAKPRQVLVNSTDEVFGGEESEPAAVSHPEGDVYDDMPDDEEQ
jgi:S-DNA-T family DNA segregation ATPase FtsK/SpoIIIE